MSVASVSVYQYTDAVSVKFQITLPDDLAAELRSVAARMRIPLAQLIRDTMRRELRQSKWEADDDPFASITGIVDSDETDLSSRIDEILYG